MNENIKNISAVFGMLTLAAFAYSSVQYVRSYGQAIDPSQTRSFTVSAEGKTVVVPDVAKISFTVLTEGGTNLEALQNVNTEKMNAVISYVKEQGVEDKDITTQSYYVQPRYQYYNCYGQLSGEVCPPAEIVGYTVQQTAQMKIRDFSKTGELLSGVVRNGANTVSQLSFSVDDRTAAENEAREEAVAKAKEKAKAIAKAGGFSVGRLLTIQESGGAQPYYPIYAEDAGFGKGGASSVLSVEPGSQDITVNVTLVYEIR